MKIDKNSNWKIFIFNYFKFFILSCFSASFAFWRIVDACRQSVVDVFFCLKNIILVVSFFYCLQFFSHLLHPFLAFKKAYAVLNFSWSSSLRLYSRCDDDEFFRRRILFNPNVRCFFEDSDQSSFPLVNIGSLAAWPWANPEWNLFFPEHNTWGLSKLKTILLFCCGAS